MSIDSFWSSCAAALLHDVHACGPKACAQYKPTVFWQGQNFSETTGTSPGPEDRKQYRKQLGPCRENMNCSLEIFYTSKLLIGIKLGLKFKLCLLTEELIFSGLLKMSKLSQALD